MERVDVATDQIGFPDGDEGGPAAAPSLRPSGCRAPGRDRRSRSPGRALPFLPGPSKIRRCASPARIAASAVGSTPLGCRSSCCPKTERAPRPVPSFRRHKRGDNQIDRTRVLEVRIQSPPAVSQQTTGSSAAEPHLPGPGSGRGSSGDRAQPHALGIKTTRTVCIDHRY